MTFVEAALSIWDEWMNKYSDQRTTNWFMMKSPFPIVTICGLYVLVMIYLTKWMNERAAYNVKISQLICNIFYLAACIFFFYKLSTLGWLTTYSWRCEPVDPSTTGTAYEMAEISWLFLMFKLTYFAESVNYVLSKNHLNAKYYVAHHATIPIFVWAVVKYIPGGHATFFGFINTLIHTIIIGYYVTIGIFPNTKKRAKKYWPQSYTILQIVHFVVFLLHTGQLLFWNDCNFPMLYVYGSLLHAAILITLFVIGS